MTIKLGNKIAITPVFIKTLIEALRTPLEKCQPFMLNKIGSKIKAIGGAIIMRITITIKIKILVKIGGEVLYDQKIANLPWIKDSCPKKFHRFIFYFLFTGLFQKGF